MARRIPPGVEVAGERELREFVSDGHLARCRHLAELVTEAEAVVEYAHGDVEGLRECGFTARQRHRERVVMVLDDALLAPGLFPALVHGVAALVRDMRGGGIAKAVE